MNKPIETLQQNASQFFDKVQAKNNEQMVCKSGCAKCCYTDISVFEVESELIEEWYSKKTEDEKLNLKNMWQNKNNEGACSFLYDEKCSIYEVRPIICRTQGLPLHLSTENVLDYCPLNFKDNEPAKDDWLNLERLNTLLSFAAASAKKDKRVRLKKLKQKMMGS